MKNKIHIVCISISVNTYLLWDKNFPVECPEPSHPGTGHLKEIKSLRIRIHEIENELCMYLLPQWFSFSSILWSTLWLVCSWASREAAKNTGLDIIGCTVW